MHAALPPFEKGGQGVSQTPLIATLAGLQCKLKLAA
jgi:hypothetical protein